MSIDKLALTLGALAVCAALVLSACGGDDSNESIVSGGGVAGLTDEAQQAALDFAECMREEGVDVPDPEPGSTGFTIDTESGIDPTDPAFQSAEQECRRFLEAAAGGSGIERVTEIPDEAFEFAKCMREQGIDFPDPKVENGMAVIGPEDPTLDPDDPEMRAASETCQELLPEQPAEGP